MARVVPSLQELANPFGEHKLMNKKSVFARLDLLDDSRRPGLRASVSRHHKRCPFMQPVKVTFFQKKTKRLFFKNKRPFFIKNISFFKCFQKTLHP